MASARQETQSVQAERLLAGKVAGQPVSCISSYQAERPVDLPGGAVAYARARGDVFVQDFGGTCDIRRGSDVYLVRTSTTSRLCRGDIAQAVSRLSAVPVGACVYQDFVPYRAPER